MKQKKPTAREYQCDRSMCLIEYYDCSDCFESIDMEYKGCSRCDKCKIAFEKKNATNK